MSLQNLRQNEFPDELAFREPCILIRWVALQTFLNATPKFSADSILSTWELACFL